MQSRRQQPTRLCCPWDSPGKNTGVGCHCLLQCMKVKSESEVASRVRLLATPWTEAYQDPPSMDFSRQEYWSGVPLPSPFALLVRIISNARDLGSIPGLGRSPGGGHGNSLRYSWLENPHGQRSLVGYSPRGCNESDTTECLRYVICWYFLPFSRLLFYFVDCFLCCVKAF